MRQRLIALLLLLSLSAGCASQEAYRAYTTALIEANKNRQTPGIEQTFDSQGRLVSQKIIFPDEPVTPQQIKDSEWVRPLTNVFLAGVGVAGLWANSHEWSNAIQSVQPNISGSYNSPGGNMAGGDISIPTEQTWTNEISTEIDQSSTFTEQQ